MLGHERLRTHPREEFEMSLDNVINEVQGTVPECVAVGVVWQGIQVDHILFLHISGSLQEAELYGLAVHEGRPSRGQRARR